MTREVFHSLRFNEKVCNGWHLYAVKMCLRAKERTKFGGDMQSRQSTFSGGNVDLSYIKKSSSSFLLCISTKDIFAQHVKKMPCNMVYYYAYFLLGESRNCLWGIFLLCKL